MVARRFFTFNAMHPFGAGGVDQVGGGACSISVGQSCTLLLAVIVTWDGYLSGLWGVGVAAHGYALWYARLVAAPCDGVMVQEGGAHPPCGGRYVTL